MATLNETDEWVAGVYQIEETDPVLGGAPNEATKAGLDNIPHLHLAKRTTWLKTRVDALIGLVVQASVTVAGIVRLSASVNSDSTSTAATSSAVKAANDNANGRALASRTVSAGGLATGGGDLTANRTITVPVATQAEAQAGTENAKAMTPLRVMQLLAAQIGMGSASSAGLLRISNSLFNDDPDVAVSAAAAMRANANANSRALATQRILAGGLATGGGDLSADRTITVPVATQAEAQAATDNTKAMTPPAGHAAARRPDRRSDRPRQHLGRRHRAIERLGEQHLHQHCGHALGREGGERQRQQPGAGEPHHLR
ncbi:hypothetical protein CNY89_06965, partial [Amaricoccus sp. HAR-UPW-R2A-40]